MIGGFRAGVNRPTRLLGERNGLPTMPQHRRPRISLLSCELVTPTLLKPVSEWISREEFGVTNNQASTYTTWLNEVVSSGLTGEMIWQAGSHFPDGDTWNDGYSVFPDGPVYPVIKQFAATLKARG